MLNAGGRALTAAIRPEVVRELTLARAPGEPVPAHVSAASGIAAPGAWLYVVVDDEVGLGVFPREGDAPGRLLALPGEELPNDPVARKKQKPDLEALCVLPPHEGAPDGALLGLGSGSAAPRHRGISWALDAHGALRGRAEPVDLSSLYAELGRHFAQLNVEGVTVSGDELLVAQRGNSAEGINAIAVLDLAGVLEALARDATIDPGALRAIERHDLPELNGVPATFTDLAALPDGRVVYTACAEATDDPVRDGEFVGAVVGILGADFAPLEPAHKVEGVWPVPDGDRIELLLVADADDRAIPAPLLRAAL
ncbi:MAG TPA: hypothetical protein VGW10_19045 [Solirubrobacteraceae bacterium]|nr:hypothetical protein [Solirubrobacteraceae bacterium]